MIVGGDMFKVSGAAVCVLGLAVSGCATVTSGTTQVVAVQTIPPGARCAFSRAGEGVIGHIPSTPGQVEVKKGWKSIQVACDRSGYPTAQAELSADLQPMTFGNILVGGIIGVAVDAATGAMAKYDGAITIHMDPSQRPTAPAEPVRERRKHDGEPTS